MGWVWPPHLLFVTARNSLISACVCMDCRSCLPHSRQIGIFALGPMAGYQASGLGVSSGGGRLYTRTSLCIG